MQLFNRIADFQTYGVTAERIASFLSSPVNVYYRRGLSLSVSNLELS
jgi:hypothetical protein